MATTRSSGQLQSTSNNLHTTFSKLEGVSDLVIQPSTLTYKERVELQRKHGYEYGRIYNYTQTPGVTVFDRLTADAVVRRTVPRDWNYSDPPVPANGGKRPGETGFVNNTSTTRLVPAVQEAGAHEQPKLAAMHPMTLRSFKQKYPLDFMAALRPGAATTNQTLRVLGTYPCDKQGMELLGIKQVPGVAPGFHPDVKA